MAGCPAPRGGAHPVLGDPEGQAQVMVIWCHSVEVCKPAAPGRAAWGLDARGPPDRRLGDHRLRTVLLAVAEAHLSLSPARPPARG